MTIVRLKPSFVWLFLATIALPFLPPHNLASGDGAVVPIRTATGLHAPTDAEFLAEYNRDRSNQKVQTWRQYWGWVQTFYKGNMLSEGWTKFSQVTLDTVKLESGRRAVVKHLNELGKIISQEWAKDTSVRKITTADLRRWNEAISEARRGDDGGGQRILIVLKSIREKAEALSGRSKVG
jgi:hypothetical protein